MAERIKRLDAYEFANLRHDYSRAYVSGDICRTDGFLTTGERKLCKEYGMVLPRPIKPQDLGSEDRTKFYYKDWWMCRIGATVDGDPAFGVAQREETWDVQPHPAYIVDGSFDVVHGGHWSLVNAAINLAEQEGGYLFLLIQPNEYIIRYKDKLPIFDELTRASWFRDFKIDWTVIWKAGESWKTGYEILKELVGIKNRKEVFFVLPDSESYLPSREWWAIWKRESQIKEAGFSVTKVRDTHIRGTSSSILRKKFTLTPTEEVLKRYPKI